MGRAEGLDHVVLAGMGGSSLAPEVITGSADVPLTVLDTTDPGQVRRALEDRLESTLLVVASKSGGTVETDSHRRIYEKAFRDAGVDPATRIVVITDPGSPLELSAREAGYRVVLADPTVGGRYSALTAFGLVPSALAAPTSSGCSTTPPRCCRCCRARRATPVSTWAPPWGRRRSPGATSS